MVTLISIQRKNERQIAWFESSRKSDLSSLSVNVLSRTF